jgi:hypothetical protein
MGGHLMPRSLLLLTVALFLLGGSVRMALACEGSEVVFEDSFADDAGGWAVRDSVELKDGKFVFKLEPDDMQSNLNVSHTVQNADICSEAVWPDGDQPVLGAGLLFWGEDKKTYYQFGVLNNGKFWIARKRDGRWDTIAENVEASSIKTGPGDANTLRVVAKDDGVTFYINGAKVRDLRGQAPKGGWRFGLSGDNFAKDKEARIIFKSVKVTE